MSYELKVHFEKHQLQKKVEELTEIARSFANTAYYSLLVTGLLGKKIIPK